MLLADASPQPYAFTAREYRDLVALGAFRGQHVQLVRGVIVRMSPAGSFHHSTVWKLDDLLRRTYGRRAMVRSQMAFAADVRSRPEPDLAVVPPGDYDDEDPSVAWLIAEVSESSLRFDRTEKAALYARAGVPVYWIVDLEGRRVEVQSKPVGNRYSCSELYSPEDLIALPKVSRRVRVSTFLKSHRVS